MDGYRAFPYLIGVDEAGRGPIAGPVTVSAVAVPRSVPDSFFRGLRDSKHLSIAAREAWFMRTKKERISRGMRYTISSVGSQIVDRRGIVFAINLATRRALDRLELNPDRCLVLLDGSLRAPDMFLHQRTIIRGDERIPVIKLASVMAKVYRDQRMKRLSKRYPDYGFEQHKGYGTRAHYRSLARCGPCDIHRKSFLRG